MKRIEEILKCLAYGSIGVGLLSFAANDRFFNRHAPEKIDPDLFLAQLFMIALGITILVINQYVSPLLPKKKMCIHRWTLTKVGPLCIFVKHCEVCGENRIG